MAYAEDIISKIDGPMFRDQRRAVMQLLCDNKEITPMQAEALEGLSNLLDAIADCAYDVYGLDTLFHTPSAIDQLAEENQYEQRTQRYNH